MEMPYLQKVTLKCCDTFNDNGPLYPKMIILLPFARLGCLDTKLTYNVITTIRIRSPRALRIVIGRFLQASPCSEWLPYVCAIRAKYYLLFFRQNTVRSMIITMVGVP
jgi:hypothetical protein